MGKKTLGHFRQLEGKQKKEFLLFRKPNKSIKNLIEEQSLNTGSKI